ncbi:gliding motility lipoprotein GldD [Aquimarina algicola]|uniref:Gliding motility lipoprotein GldD n=1 Tax=Aquimarina algicola TaxID=2589995 RepID=A0A504J9N7_9FLAO|nr:gliding motility lipoprotein GldD [Aquimarina algicola]TPN87587.1 gliding motility lipoprotein GldD [Aquimarina algicola]
MKVVIKSSWIIMVSILLSCKGEVLPKPKGMLRLSYPNPKYQKTTIPCAYSFEKNDFAELENARRNRKCWYNLEYKKLKATMYISYFRINNNLDSLLRDAQNLTQEHFIKADAIKPEEYVNSEKRVFGTIYKVSGDAASPSQFYATDSTNHFLVGSIYFKVKPNYDSILPAAEYLRNDIRHMIETLEWQE